MSGLVSVVTPTYNYARFVGRAIDSVLAQTYGHVECIVVDDGSTDDTPNVLSRYGERVTVIRNQNRGPAVARNTGVRAARGEYIAFLDSDDFWLPDKISRQMSVFESNPDLGAVGCAHEFVDASGNHFGKVTFHPLQRTELRRQIRGIATREMWIGTSCSGALISRACLDTVGLFDEMLTAAEDWDLWLRIASRFPILNLPDVLVAISRHGGGFARDAEKVERNQWKVYESAISRWPDVLDARIRRRIRALILADAGGEHAGARKFGVALRYYVASLWQWPLHRLRWYTLARLLLKTAGI